MDPKAQPQDQPDQQDDQSQDDSQQDGSQDASGQQETYGGDPDNKVEQFFMSRFAGIDPKAREIIGNSMTPPVASAWLMAFPELKKILMYAMHKASITNHIQMQVAQQGQQSQGSSPQSTPGGPPQAPQAPNQLQPQDVGSALGFASGGLMSNGGMKKNIGYVNKQIPTNSLARGGMPLALPHVSPPGGLPAEAKFNSRAYNNPHYDSGGLIGSNPYGQGGMMLPDNANAISDKSTLGYADGGMGAPPQQANNNAPAQPMTSGDPQVDQAMNNQKIAEQVVPSEGTADGVPAKLSKGEYVMDAASVMYFGVGKLQQMQEKAHADLAKHLTKQQMQQAQQDDGSGGSPQQQPQGQPQQNQAQQQAPQGLGAPSSPMPQQMPPQAAPQPDPTQQRIQQSASPPPAPPPQNPMSLMSRPPGNSPLG